MNEKQEKKLTIRMDEETRRKLKILSAFRNMSMQKYIINSIEISFDELLRTNNNIEELFNKET